MYSERRRMQLKREGVHTEEVESTAKSFIESMKIQEMSLQEGALVLEEMDCILSEMRKCNPNSKIK
ncbi:hypothetical protein DSECCO2_488690 [anaerobic digester metagenome]